MNKFIYLLLYIISVYLYIYLQLRFFFFFLLFYFVMKCENLHLLTIRRVNIITFLYYEDVDGEGVDDDDALIPFVPFIYFI